MPATKGQEEEIGEDEPERTFHDELMRPRNEREPVVMVERLRNILPERLPRPRVAKLSTHTHHPDHFTADRTPASDRRSGC